MTRDSVMIGLLLAAALAFPAHGQSCGPGNPCPPGSECHPDEERCYQNPPGTNRPYVWLGTAPDDCDRRAEDCALFGFEYNMTHPRGDGSEWCSSGERIRCFAPAAPPLADPTPANELRMISYNIFERDFAITNDGQRERTCRIPYILLQKWPNVDVIGIQEGFMGGCFDQEVSLRDLFKHLGFPYATATVSSEDLPENGGIFLVSRWPMLAVDQLVFESADEISADGFVAKGVSYAKVRKTSSGQSRDYHVMTTHYQANRRNEDVRVNQSLEWADFVQQKNIPADEPVIYSGDLNADYYTRNEHLNEIIDILKARLPTYTGTLNATTTPENDVRNSTSGPDHTPRWIDYVLYSTEHVQPQGATIQSLFPHAEEHFPVCWCEVCVPLGDYIYYDDPDCEEVNRIRHLSDHQPVLGTFTY